MTVDYICREVERLKRKFHETDPFKLCDAMGIILLYAPMGTYPGACKIVLQLRKCNPNLHLIAASPYEGFESRWSGDWQRRYTAILEQADLVGFICKGYSKSCFQIRNEWIVNKSARVIAVYNGEPGGTRNTIEYAERNKVECFKI